MKTSLHLKKYIAHLASILMEVDDQEFNNLIENLRKIKKNKLRLFIAGNGGSAAIASHIAIDLANSLSINCLNFNEPSLITCYSNDYGYENWLSSCVKNYCDKKDYLILISSSGTSKNIINSANEAKKKGMKLITFSGFKSSNPLRQKGLINFWVDSDSYNFVESTHLIILLSAIDYLKKS